MHLFPTFSTLQNISLNKTSNITSSACHKRASQSRHPAILILIWARAHSLCVQQGSWPCQQTIPPSKNGILGLWSPNQTCMWPRHRSCITTQDPCLHLAGYKAPSVITHTDSNLQPLPIWHGDAVYPHITPEDVNPSVPHGTALLNPLCASPLWNVVTQQGIKSLPSNLLDICLQRGTGAE